MAQIDISLLIAFLSLCVAALVGFSNLKTSKTSKDKQEASELTTILVKLENINNGVNEIKSDLRSVKGDVQALRDRIIRLEEAEKSDRHRIDGLEQKNEDR